ncbi:site-specific integrase [Aquimarina aquimarini]|uniref:site-specific integrase n=1 Tax=Aquimarina aquimarini TaxID=1191734 RepID=UPI000D55E04F|nr:site-specific integrase [Aquimarina aquimarini]
MTSVEIVLFKGKKNKEGKHPLALRIIKDRKPSYKFLEYIHLKDWNAEKTRVRGSNRDYKLLNNLCDNEKTRASNLVRDYDAKNKKYSSVQIINILKGKGDTIKTFFELTDLYLKEINIPSKYNHHRSEKIRFNNLKKYTNNRDVHFEEITEGFLKRFIIYLKNNGNSATATINGHLSLVRKLFNRAIREGYVGRQYYPFSRGGICFSKVKTLKIGLNKEEIKSLEQLDLSEKPVLDHARNVFLFSFYFAGIRISDVLRIKWSNFQNGRLYYQMEKNEKADSLVVPEKVKCILAIYQKDKNCTTDYVFPELKGIDRTDIEAVTKKVNATAASFSSKLKTIAKLAGIEKKITPHIARHSFGNIAGSDIPIRMLQKLYRHSNLSTTIGYQSNFDHSQTDEALNNVLDF